MSGPDGIDERFGTLVGELRSGEATASPELRERVRAIATAGAGAAGGAGPALAFPRRQSGARARARLCARRGGRRRSACSPRAAATRHGEAAKPATVDRQRPIRRPPPVRSRLRRTRRRRFRVSGRRLDPPAERLASPALLGRPAAPRLRPLGDDEARDPAHARRGAGTCSTSTRVANQKLGRRVPDAARPDHEGADRAREADLAGHDRRQPRLDPGHPGPAEQRFGQMADLRAQIAKLRAKLTRHESDREPARLHRRPRSRSARRRIVRLQDAQTAQKTRASFATVALELETKKAAVVVPSQAGPDRRGARTTSAACSSPRRRSCSTYC